jgi:hypothetical protein
VIEINLPNDGSKPDYECWTEGDNILNMHISPEEDQTFQIDVDKSTHELILSRETEDGLVVTVKPRGTIVG